MWGRIYHFEEYLRIIEEERIRSATVKARKEHTRIRRAEFNASRSLIHLAMIEAGIPYVCSRSGCGVTENLTIDHILPLSRGGTDELTNLCFMCRVHNSEKGIVDSSA